MINFLKGSSTVIKNKYFLFWTRFFIEINAINAVIQLFYLQRGLNTSEILYLGIAWSVATLVFEVPTGYLADRIGRKNTIILGVVINIIANVLMFAAYGFWPFALITALLSFSFSCFSGTEDAIIFDSLREIGDEKSLLRISGRYQSAARISKIFTPFFGALIAQNLTSAQFTILLGINASSSVLALITSLRLVEPNKFVDVAEKEKGIFRDSLKLAKDNPVINKLILNKTLVFIGGLVFWRIYQPFLLHLGFDVFYLGVLYFIFQTILTVIYWNPERLRSQNTLAIFRIVPILALLSAIYVFMGTNRWLVYIASMGILILSSVRDPFFTEIIQHHLKSYNRATATSVLNLYKSVFDIPLLLVSGFFARGNIKNVMVIPVILFFAVILFFHVNKKDIADIVKGLD